MASDGASRTAEFMALFRALEASRRPATRLFHDPFAVGFLRPSLRAVAHLSCIPALGSLVAAFVDRRWPGARTSGVARTRLIDDALLRALGQGIEQVVILGAGFDCRAYRMPAIRRARVFEVDRPPTLTAKKERVRRTLGALPEHVAFVEVDFTMQDLREAIEAAAFDPTARSFFLLEGVTNYLTEKAVDSVLRHVSRMAAAGSSILFTYVHRGLLDGSVEFEGTENLMATLRRVGEPWTFGIDPRDLSSYLGERGFELIEDLGAAEYRARVLGPSARRMKGYEFYRAALARVDGARDRRAPAATRMEVRAAG